VALKRGLIAWDKTELPPEAFESRLAALRRDLAARGLQAALFYSDVWQSNYARYFTNFMPYWNRALAVIPVEDKPVLLCSLSPRVYPWIKSVTIFEEIKPSPNLAQRVFEMCAEKGWKKLGTAGALPFDLHRPLRGGEVLVEEIAWRGIADQWAIAMHRRAAELARHGLHAEMGAAVGLIDHEFAARLEHRYRRAGAEDLVILLSNGDKPPAPAKGAPLGESFSVSVALEYRGHWVRVIRNNPSLTGPPEDSRRDRLSGPYPYEAAEPGEQPGTLFAVRSEIRAGDHRLFYGDSYVRTEDGAELL
jgi:hypothetical protein